VESLTSGTMAGTGSFRCVRCDHVVAVSVDRKLPECPECGGIEFLRATAFGTASGDAAADGTSSHHSGDWLSALRASLEPGQYLACEEDGQPVAFPLTHEWTRIGRALASDIRFDDPTVSRRHVLVVRQPDGVRILDDRSLNGLFVNEKRSDGRILADGDEVVVGRHRLYFLDVTVESRERDNEATLSR
jgi:hypothetical protein